MKYGNTVHICACVMGEYGSTVHMQGCIQDLGRGGGGGQHDTGVYRCTETGGMVLYSR